MHVRDASHWRPIRSCLAAIALLSAATSAGVAAQSIDAVGVNVGVNKRQGRTKDWRVGAQFSVLLITRVSFVAGADLYLRDSYEVPEWQGPEVSDVTKRGWYSFVQIETMPFGAFWSVGLGLSFTRELFNSTVRSSGESYSSSCNSLGGIATTGIELPLGMIRPFIELQVVDHWGGINVWQPLVFAGLNVRLP